jgi:uroporphyrinogen-III synthase
MEVLVTRPNDEALELAKAIKEMGHSPIIAPLFQVTKLKNINDESLKHYQAIIITSRNALKSINNLKDKKIPLLVVGEKSNEVAKSLGFVNAIFAGRNSKELKEYIHNYQRLLYLSGADITEDFSALGKKITREIVYNAEKVKEVPEEFFKFLKNKDEKIALFFSQRSAIAFLNIIKGNNLENLCHNITVISLSDKISECFQGVALNANISAAEPTLENILETLKHYANGR